MGQMFFIRAYSLVSLVSTCNATVNGECVTNGVVRFFVCCATFALSVRLFFFNAELVFRAMSLRTLCDTFHFLAIISIV